MVAGALLFTDGLETTLRAGDHLFVPAHERHQVTGTEPDLETAWLNIFWPKKSPLQRT